MDREARDPSTREHEFADRLSAAIATRGLTLERIRQHLAARDAQVSTATLSYWSTGRSQPTRGKSLTVLAALEEVLHLPPGHLTEVLPRGNTHPPGSSLGRVEAMREALERHGIVRNTGWAHLLVHQRYHIGADGAQKGFEQRRLMRATASGAQTWAMAMSAQPGEIVCEQSEGCLLSRRFDLGDGLEVFEFSLSRPLEVGEMALAAYRLAFRNNGDTQTTVGLGLTRPLERLVLEACFDGELPASLGRTFTEPGGGLAMPIEKPIYLHEGTAQVAIAHPAPGLHSIAWQW